MHQAPRHPRVAGEAGGVKTAVTPSRRMAEGREIAALLREGRLAEAVEMAAQAADPRPRGYSTSVARKDQT